VALSFGVQVTPANVNCGIEGVSPVARISLHSPPEMHTRPAPALNAPLKFVPATT
jgi:hypothetical protein